MWQSIETAPRDNLKIIVAYHPSLGSYPAQCMLVESESGVEMEITSLPGGELVTKKIKVRPIWKWMGLPDKDNILPEPVKWQEFPVYEE